MGYNYTQEALNYELAYELQQIKNDIQKQQGNKDKESYVMVMIQFSMYLEMLQGHSVEAVAIFVEALIKHYEKMMENARFSESMYDLCYRLVGSLKAYQKITKEKN